VYYAAIMVKAATPPTLAGVAVENAAVAGAVITGQAVLAQTSGLVADDDGAGDDRDADDGGERPVRDRDLTWRPR
jgi:hypothetical protein